MKKNITLLLLTFFITTIALHAQVKKSINLEDLKKLKISTTPAFAGGTSNNYNDKCGFAFIMHEARNKGFNDALYEQEMARLIYERRLMNNFGPPTTIYTLPVIFHISYDGTTESVIGNGANISQALINAQIDQLNKDFADLSGSVYGVAEDLGVRFVAARVDPSGNLLCESGIERINWRSRSGWLDPTTLTSTTAVINHYSNIVKPQSIWDPYRYVNIWLGNFDASGLLGYATFPSQSTLPGLDNAETDQTAGVVVMSGSVGSLINPGTAIPYQFGRTLTHELGHFFGLRHITGDANCGEDYCDDTPLQFELTSGCPAPGTLNECTPSVPKMFENYMDYSNDACLNTFTLNQSERCQTVMLNSPRRKEVITSTTANSIMPNRVFFKSGVSSVVETATGSCPRFKDYNIIIGVDVTASGNATVSLLKSGTATDLSDYSILQPSVSYTNGDAADKTFTLRVYDDAVVDGTETILLSLNISGTGVQTAAACASVNQFTVTLNDDDILTAINNSTPVVTLLSQDFGTVTGSNQVPAGWTVSNSGTATNKWVGNNADALLNGFSGNCLHISDGNTGSVNNGTAPINYDDAVTTDARVTTPALNALGLKNIKVTFNFVCNGEADINGIYDYGIVYYSLDGSNYNAAKDINGDFIIQGIDVFTTATFYLPANVAGTNSLRFLFRWISDNSISNQPPFAIDDVIVTGDFVTVESQLNNNGTENITAGPATNYFYSTTDAQIIATIANTSEAVGCVTANIQSQGTNTTILNTSGGSFMRSEKVISLVPTVANTTATYQATFYFTSAELTAWGANVPNLKLMKVKNGVNLAGVITTTDAQVVSAIVDDQRSTKGYASFTGNFTDGFSQFLLVSPTTVVPVNNLVFDARAQAKNILLNWSTSNEINNKGFVIERSTDAVRFDKIGWVNGNLNSNQTSHYTFADNFVQPNLLYLYRLRQTDVHNHEKLSEIRQAKIKDHNISIMISPNPANNRVAIFTSGIKSWSNITLHNTKGQLLKTWKQVNTFESPATLDISSIIAGVYFFQVRNDEAVFTEKIIIN
jgi:Pregnancy-associated plasma protein-A/Secretion system C-terminal sorting domain